MLNVRFLEMWNMHAQKNVMLKKKHDLYISDLVSFSIKVLFKILLNIWEEKPWQQVATFIANVE